LCGFELLVLGFVRTKIPWLWLLLLTLPFLTLFLRHEQRKLQSMLVVFLDELAKEWHLTKVSTDKSSQERTVSKTTAPDPRSPFAETASKPQ
jgi:hypothetical protein